MTTYCLEMRSTAQWDDVRYREYTSSARKAELFKKVPRIRFTDSGHHIIPHVHEHQGKKLPRNTMLQDHVIEAITAANKANPVKRQRVVHGDVIEALTQAEEYFENLADMSDGDYGEPSPNTEMRLAQLCRDALERVRVATQ